MKRFKSDDVQATFNSYPEKYRQPLLIIRDLIFDVASKSKEIGDITETLKWGQPSYLTEATGSGSTVRLDRFGSSQVAIFFHCQTTLVDSFKLLFPELNYSKNRAIIFDPDRPLALDALGICIEMALTYKLRKK